MSKNEKGAGLIYEHYEMLISAELRNAIIQTFKSFAYGYSIKTIIALLFNLKNIKKNPILFIKLFFRSEQIDAGMFLGTYCFVMKTLQILQKKYWKHPALNSFLSGFAGGLLSMQFIKKENRAVFALYTLARSLDTIFQAHIKKKWEKGYKYFYTFLFVLLQIQVYFYSVEPITVPKSIFKFYTQVSCQSENEKILHHMLICKQNIYAQRAGIEPQDAYKILGQRK